MREGWRLEQLGAICSKITDGSHFSPKSTTEGYPYITVRDVIGDKIDFENCKFVSSKDFEALRKNGCRPLRNDVLFSKDGTVGKVTLVDYDKDFVVLSSLAILRPDTSKVDPRYLKYLMQAPSILIEAVGRKTGVAIRRVVLRNLKTIGVPVPSSLEEQANIVAILDEAFAGLAIATVNAEKNLKNARELFESYLNSAFTRRAGEWAEKSLREVSIEFGRGKSKHRPRNDPSLYGGKYPFIQTGDIRNAGGVIIEYTQTYNERGLAQSKLWPKGTICITIAANIAETGILGFDACFPDSVIGMVVDPTQTNNKFVEYLLRFFKAILQAQGKGSAQDNINLATFENRKFPFPSVKIQNELAAGLDAMAEKVRHLESSYKGKLQRISELRQSILQKAFSGELTSPPSQAIREAAE